MCSHTHDIEQKKHRKKFGDMENKSYLCSSYPENNLLP